MPQFVAHLEDLLREKPQPNVIVLPMAVVAERDIGTVSLEYPMRVSPSR